jgi:circadian clock protein KaiC
MTEMTIAPARPLRTLATGIPGLDTVLGGGLIRGATYVVLGETGAGKTVLANHLAFNHASAAGRALYVTVLGAEHAHMLSFMQSFRFYQPDVIGHQLTYLSGYGSLEDGGLDGLHAMLQQAMRAGKYQLLILDTLGVIESFGESERVRQLFIRRMQTLAAVLGFTLVLLRLKEREQPYGEIAVADGVIELRQLRHGQQVARELEVAKFRGAPALTGRHLFTIMERGVEVWPRTESLYARPSAIPPFSAARRPFGIPRLDEMLDGGLLSGSITLLLGSPGTGKTPFGLAFLSHGAASGEPGLHFGFYEMPPRLLGKSDQLGLEFGRYVEDGSIELIWQPPVEQNLDALACHLLQAIDRREVSRLFLDGIDGFLQAALFQDRFESFLITLCNELRARNVTCLFSAESRHLVAGHVELPFGSVSATLDNILLLRHAENGYQFRRLLSIMKARGILYDPAVQEFTLTASGISLAEALSESGSAAGESSGQAISRS